MTLVVLAGCGSLHTDPPAPGNDVGTRLNGPIPSRIANLPMRTSDGTPTTIAAYAGKVLVISDSMTLCQETCPLDTSNVVTAAKAAQRSGVGDRVEFLTITVDPQRDTTTRLAAYRKFYAAPDQLPNWQLLTGSPKAIDALWSYLGVFRKKVPQGKPPGIDWLTHQPLTYDIVHSDQVFFLDGRQHERFVISGMADVSGPKTVPAGLRSFLDEHGRHNLKHPGAGSWTVGQVLQTVSWLTGHQISG